MMRVICRASSPGVKTGVSFENRLTNDDFRVVRLHVRGSARA